jgi:succinate dehydrogenase/fumarate reductase iron-sulfur protein
MKIVVKRFHQEREPQSIEMSYEVPLDNCTLLEALTYIKRHEDATLTFASGCRSSVCGSCAVRVNGSEVLACAHKVQDGDSVEPLRFMPVIKDLIVDASRIEETIKRAKAFSSTKESKEQSHDAMLKIQTQTDCILCGSCYSACPVLEAMPDFLGPFALTRSWRQASDSRNEDIKSTIDAVQNQGIWDCTLCNECVPVCPSGIAPKQDIAMLQSKSGMMGYMNPSFGGGMDFGSNPWD